MDMRAEILKEHSRAQSEMIAKWVGKDASRFEMLLQLFLHDEYRVVQRAAWILSIVAEKYPLPEAFLPAILKRMSDTGLPVAVKRNVLRILQFLVIPETYHGEVMTLCFRFLEDVKETIAVRVFAMSVLSTLAKTYPDIRQELIFIIEDQLSQGASAGFKSRAKKVLHSLTKL